MNHSIYSADRVTHLKIIVIALAAAATMVSITMSARVGSNVDTVTVVKPGKPMAITDLNTPSPADRTTSHATPRT
ncbi:MAG: hypothetical protein KGL35_22555 [Bradyrhizobium sp.]|nr:hypothetical protein [Pseudomonadota bacterium]MDE2471430.1 hypothetical protein [Bradyrhizobium sp.]